MDDVCDFQRIADVINHIHPEVVALQELDSMTHRSGQKYVLGEIAGRTQMHAYFAPAIDYDGGKYGIGLLTKEIPVSLKTMTLPGREEARALIMAEFDNYRKRTMKEKAELILNGGEKSISSILPIVDDFERALKNMETATDVAAVKEGDRKSVV